MTVLYYQIGILVIILISSLFGKMPFYIVLTLSVLWTGAMVHTPELFFAQIITVIIGFLLGNKMLGDDSKKT